MKTARRTLPAAALLACIAITPVAGRAEPAAGAPATVSLPTLLEEMLDRDEAARWPSPAFMLGQASSYDRRNNDPGNPETWFANNDHGQFIHTEVNEGRREWVIMHDEGPGAVVRFWIPLLADKNAQVIRFYLDGAPAPAFAARINDLFRGADAVPPPFAFVSWDETDLRNQVAAPRKDAVGVGGDLYLPIPYARSCKITLDQVPFYYVINFRRYAPGTRVETFSREGLAAAQPALARVGAALLADPPAPAGTELTRQATLAPGAELALDLPAGAAAVRRVRVRLAPEGAAAALRAVVLTASFDGAEAVWCPLGDFFGAGVRLNPVRDWWRRVEADGTLEARWTMPYQRSGRLALKNVGAAPAAVTLDVMAGPWAWDERSLHFRSNWRSQREIKTRPMSDWNYIELQGQARYAGDTLTVFSPVRAWYGEGDERVYLDGATFPAHIGTGTEDYYGFAWGMATFFNSPFIAVPRRDAASREDWTGYTTTSRVRLLDAIPVRTALKLDMEIWNWADTQMDYAAAVFWYARPGAAHNRPPQPEEAAVPVREAPGRFAVRGAVECETAQILARSPGLRVGTQDLGLKQGQWSGGSHLFVQAGSVGDFVELQVPAAGGEARRLTLHATRSYDYGILRFSVNGQPAGGDVDLYSAEPAASGPLELGTFAPQDGGFRVRAEVVGANPASTGPRHYFGLDCLVPAQP